MRPGNEGGPAVEVPEDIVERIRTLCLALPEVTVRVDGSLNPARSTAQSFDIRRRWFCLLVAREGSAGKPIPLLMLRAGPDERDALQAMQYSNQEVAHMLRSWGYPQLADEALRDLADPVDLDELREWNLRHGLTRDDIISHMGGSPESA